MAKPATVAEFLSKAIELSGKTQREVAEGVGYSKPNVISMMRLGQTKIPIEKIPVFAKTLGVDPAMFTRIAMQEYMPAVWAAISSTFGESLTKRERDFVGILRDEDPDGQTAIDTFLITQVKDVIRDRRKTPA